jgi:isopenicillin N synthase-like dioxygenase
MSTPLPVIDVRQFGDASWYPALDEACAGWGCFHIIDHGVADDLLEETMAAMRSFFALEREAKLAIERTRDNAWGFFDRELTKNVRDFKEIFDVGPAAQAGPMKGSVPQWPASLPDFRPVVEAFYAAAEQVPVCEAPDEHLGISHHTDAGALTVLLTDDQAGLQFEHDGAWQTVEPLPGALTVNIGDIVQVWSNDRYRAPLHRVLASATAERFSAPFFYNPSYELDYAPLPGVVSDASPARYEPINWGAFRAGRAAGDYADHGEEIQISHFRR